MKCFFSCVFFIIIAMNIFMYTAGLLLLLLKLYYLAMIDAYSYGIKEEKLATWLSCDLGHKLPRLASHCMPREWMQVSILHLKHPFLFQSILLRAVAIGFLKCHRGQQRNKELWVPWLENALERVPSATCIAHSFHPTIPPGTGCSLAATIVGRSASLWSGLSVASWYEALLLSPLGVHEL